RAAEFARTVIECSLETGKSLGVAIEEANRVVGYDNDQNARLDLSSRSGAVLACATVRPDGVYESRTIQDSENFLISFPIGGGMPRVDYWSTRPTNLQRQAYALPTLADGRLPWGWERVIRLDPQSATVEAGLGLIEGAIFQNVDTVV